MLSYLYLFTRKRRNRDANWLLWKRKQASRRRKYLRQAQERSLFMTFLLVNFFLSTMDRQPRIPWMKERSGHWWDRIVNDSFTAQDWLDNFRVSRSTFLYLCNKLKPSISKQDTIMRKAIPTEKRVALTLWFLATGSEYRTIGHLFGVAKSTVCMITKEVCSCVVTELLPTYIKFPTGTCLKQVVEGFRTVYGFPQCAGAVDGTHIPIVSPPECPADYYNRKGFHSVLMQGTVDNQGLFIDIYVGWPGRVHDARVFVNSSLFKRGQTKTLLPDWKKKLGSNDVPLVILGDPAYPLLDWLMKAYPDTGHLTQQQRRFNYRLSRARVVVEHSYGKLKGRWRCLLKRLDVEVSDVPELVAACCVLHNICEVHGDSFNEDWIEGTDVSLLRCSNPAAPSHPLPSSMQTRNTLTSYFINN